MRVDRIDTRQCAHEVKSLSQANLRFVIAELRDTVEMTISNGRQTARCCPDALYCGANTVHLIDSVLLTANV